MKLSQLVAKFDSMDLEGNTLYPSLTLDQQLIHDTVLAEFNSNVKYAVLDSRSGSGKTTTIRAIIKTAKSMHLNVIVTATTGKASSALGGQTIHSFLGMKMTQNDNANSIDEALLLKGSDTSVETPDILIIDEASMIGQDLFREITKHKFNYVLFVLDNSQLPPVKSVKVEWDDVAQSKHYLYKTLRAQDKDMVKLFDDFKEYKEGRLQSLDLHDYINGRNIVKIDYNNMDFVPKNSDSCCVSYRNKLVEFIANKITCNGHNKYNLNASVSITKMVTNGETDRNGFMKREFKNDIVYYNGEDVKIDILKNETTAMQRNGYCMYKNFKLSIAKSGKGISIVDTKADKTADTYYITFPVDEVLEHCSLAIIEDKYFILIWDSSEDEYKQMLSDLFSHLAPKLAIHNQFKKYCAGKLSVNQLHNELRYLVSVTNDLQAFKDAYDKSDMSYDRKQAWANFMSAKGVVTARYTTSRTITKAQGISIPCVIITNNSFYGASKAAEYVGITRGRHGVILVENVPNIIKGEHDEQDDIIEGY